MDYLTLVKVFHFRCNTMGVPKVEGGRVVGFRPSPIRGVPDIIAIRPGSGRSVGIEVKRPGCYLSEHQEAFRAAFTAAGGEYHIIHGLDEAQEMVAGWRRCGP